MVHYRLNEKQANPNPHINFTSALPATSQDDAHQLLSALAAQVRPVMKAHGFSVNSLEEYEHNSIFLGRNWNNGETIELVLRRRDGMFLPSSSLMSTLCHELAHIKHMNHGPAFQALWLELRNDVRNLQNKGYYGDGYWSSGNRLADGARVSGTGIQPGDLPQYMCGGAHSRSRPVATGRRRAGTQTGPSLHTGSQTSKKRKAGTRVTRADAFVGVGVALNSGDVDATKGTGFGKQAKSKRAREERALAAERRSQAHARGQPNPSTSTSVQGDPGTDSDLETETVAETDEDRLKFLMDSIKDEGLNDLGDEAWDVYDCDFNFNIEDRQRGIDRHSASAKKGENDKSKVVANGEDEYLPRPDTSRVSTASSSSTRPSRSKTTDKECDESSSSRKKLAKGNVGLGRLVQTEIDFRKKESLGLASGQPARKLGMGGPNSNSGASGIIDRLGDSPQSREEYVPWSCLVCTLSNSSEHLACSACGTTRGESVWIGER